MSEELVYSSDPTFKTPNENGRLLFTLHVEGRCNGDWHDGSSYESGVPNVDATLELRDPEGKLVCSNEIHDEYIANLWVFWEKGVIDGTNLVLKDTSCGRYVSHAFGLDLDLETIFAETTCYGGIVDEDFAPGLGGPSCLDHIEVWTDISDGRLLDLEDVWVVYKHDPSWEEQQRLYDAWTGDDEDEDGDD